MVVKLKNFLINTKHIKYISDVDVINNEVDYYRLCRFQIHFDDKNYLSIEYRLTETITTMKDLETYTTKIHDNLGLLMNHNSEIIDLESNKTNLNIS